MSTFTASELTSQPKVGHAGLQAKSCIQTVSSTGTASSVFLFVKIPNGATIHDFTWYMADAAANQTYKLGILTPEGTSSWTVTESVLASDLSATGGQTHRATGTKLPYHFSFSENGRQSWGWIQAVAAAAISASAHHRFSVYYTMDGG